MAKTPSGSTRSLPITNARKVAVEAATTVEEAVTAALLVTAVLVATVWVAALDG